MSLYNDLKPRLPSPDDPMYLPFLEKRERLYRAAGSYAGKADELIRRAEGDVERWEYAVGGETIQRGFYCPSLVFDILMGNVRRGRIFKRLTGKSGPSTIFGFDKSGSLILAHKMDEHSPFQPYESEVITASGESTLGVTFHYSKIHMNYRHLPVNIVECAYEGKLIKTYRNLRIAPINEKSLDYYEEEYSYPTGDRMTVTVNTFTDIHFDEEPENPYHLLRTERCDFKIADGFLSEYDVHRTLNGKADGQTHHYETPVRRRADAAPWEK